MKPVVKLWYNSEGELRLLKEWHEKRYFGSIERYELAMSHAKSESLHVVNADEVIAGYVFKEELKRDSFHDLPGATWEVKGQCRYNDEQPWEDVIRGRDQITWHSSLRNVAVIHLPKPENSAHGYSEGSDPGVAEYYEKAHNSGPIRSPGCDPDNPEPDLIDQLAAANKRIVELEYVLKVVTLITRSLT